MIGLLNELEILGAEINGETQVDIILQPLPNYFKQFFLNYNMNKLSYSLEKLHKELQVAKGLIRNPIIALLTKKGKKLDLSSLILKWMWAKLEASRVTLPYGGALNLIFAQLDITTPSELFIKRTRYDLFNSTTLKQMGYDKSDQDSEEGSDEGDEEDEGNEEEESDEEEDGDEEEKGVEYAKEEDDDADS
ncbi:uncharacterized protein LOC131151307 [Malania oleifera]|uniref:uncharacterized protein LOC131151307 n=1 Tax=Malania oleifera TaxID=397392 RepID=UPI0025ADC354|nr:uncharacterized protein LOC131151307 [Malania oleifera]